jgi:hypothetical protein
MGMRCVPAPGHENDLTNLVIELIGHDLYELYQNLSEKLKWVIHEDEVGDIFQDWPKDEIHSILSFFKNSFNQM